ncbi:MAG: NAD(P)-dependent alcohol dehydrogenase [Candidatus Cloacimonetes bacterium]|nr:NAD(P)-dependent alcohol dehydrogenase [Candidatus Cloacimonadota bacterium]
MENKAVFLTELGKMEFRDIPVPEIGIDEVLVKMEAIGICGSDLHYYSNGKIGNFIVDFPFILGHECAGTIVKAGEKVKHLEVGDRVALEPGVPCGKCELCLSGQYNLCPDVKFFATPPYHGCLQNYVKHQASFAFKLPDNVSSVEGALVEPLAIGINAVQTGGVKLGDSVVIFGAGCIGLVSLLSSKASGATQVIVVDVIDKRLEVAKGMGATIINAKNIDAVAEILRLTGGKGARVVIDCAGNNITIPQTVKVAKAGGNVVWVGMGIDEINGMPLGPLSTKELTIKSIFRYKNLYPTTIAAIADGKIDISGIVSNKFRFEDTPSAYAESLHNKGNVVKSVIVFE